MDWKALGYEREYKDGKDGQHAHGKEKEKEKEKVLLGSSSTSSLHKMQPKAMGRIAEMSRSMEGLPQGGASKETKTP